MKEFEKNRGYPVGGGLWVLFKPEDKISSPYKEWDFSGTMIRMPEFVAPALGNKENIVTVDAIIPENASGVLYSLGGFSGGLVLYVKDGILSCEHNLFEINPTHIRASKKLKPGPAKIEITTRYEELKPAGPLKVLIKVDGKEVASGVVPIIAPIGFTANDGLDIGTDLGSPVSVDYFDNAAFPFNGQNKSVHVKYLTTKN